MVGAALGAMDAPLPFEEIFLASNELTAAGMRSIAEGMGRGRLPNLRRVTWYKDTHVIDSNRALGDGEVAALAEALADCASLEVLHLNSCGVGGAGFEALAAQVPRWPRLRGLYVSGNPGPSDALGRALAVALPSLPDAELFELSGSVSEEVMEELEAARAATGSEVDFEDYRKLY